MRIPVSDGRRRAFTFVYVLMAVGMIFVVGLLVLPNFRRPRCAACRISCVNNLKNTGLAFRTFAVDFNGDYPWMAKESGLPARLRTNDAKSGDLIHIFAAVSNELSTPKIVICPSDTRPLPRTNTWGYLVANPTEGHTVPSYFLGLDSREERPESIMAGDRNIMVPGDSGFDWRKITANSPAWRRERGCCLWTTR